MENSTCYYYGHRTWLSWFQLFLFVFPLKTFFRFKLVDYPTLLLLPSFETRKREKSALNIFLRLHYLITQNHAIPIRFFRQFSHKINQKFWSIVNFYSTLFNNMKNEDFHFRVSNSQYQSTFLRALFEIYENESWESLIF